MTGMHASSRSFAREQCGGRRVPQMRMGGDDAGPAEPYSKDTEEKDTEDTDERAKQKPHRLAGESS